MDFLREDYSKLPNNETCNVYLKEVFLFYIFIKQENKQSESLKVLSDAQKIVRNSIRYKKRAEPKELSGVFKRKRTSRKNH